ncbi:hypothetical protein JZU71_04265, partial [bacterium]|nr:hypothetical protein [bacterium]
VKLPDMPPEPSEEGFRRMNLDRLMKNIDLCISSGKADCARDLYHYFVDEFRHEMKPDLGLPPLSIQQPRLDL